MPCVIRHVLRKPMECGDYTLAIGLKMFLDTGSLYSCIKLLDKSIHIHSPNIYNLKFRNQTYHTPATIYPKGL